MSDIHANIEAEENLLAAMLLDQGQYIDSVIGAVGAEDFYLTKHGTIFTSILDMHMRNETVDPVTVAAELEKHGRLDQIGGGSKLHELLNLTPAGTAAPRYAKLVRDKAVIRGLSLAGEQIKMLAAENDGSELDEKLAKAEQFLSDAVLRNTKHSAVSITDGLDEFIAGLKESILSGTPRSGLLTRVNKLDAMLNGFWPGQLVILAARPAVGKSTLAQNIAENVADFKEDGRVLFVTLEMSREEMLLKGLSRAGRIDGLRLGAHLITEDEQKRMKDAIGKVRLRDGKLLVDDSGMATVPALAAEATRLHRQGGLDLIVVDYLQLMQGVGEKKVDEVGSISRGLKLLARRLNVPILALSQMNRSILHRSEKRPDMSDLRDSGSLEQDADVVLFLHRDSDFDPDKMDDGDIEIIVAKNRRGPTGSEKVPFVKRYGSFLNLKEAEAA